MRGYRSGDKLLTLQPPSFVQWDKTNNGKSFRAFDRQNVQWCLYLHFLDRAEIPR
jgi:hypothetical protein